MKNLSREDFNEQIALPNVPIPVDSMAYLYSRTIAAPAPLSGVSQGEIQTAHGAYAGNGKRPILTPKGQVDVESR
jgi:hypothetical protein